VEANCLLNISVDSSPLRREKRLKKVSHYWRDYDGLTAEDFLRLFGSTKIPGIESAEEVCWDGDPKTIPRENVVFVDTCPKGVTNDPTRNVWVFDHHPHTEHPWKPDSKNDWEHYHTATSRVIEFLGLNFDDPKITDLVRQAFRADYKSSGDTMTIDNVIKEMHLLYKEDEISRWFAMTVEAHFKGPEKLEPEELQKGIEFFKKLLEKFLSENKDSLEKTILQKWIEKKLIEDKMNVAYQAAVISVVFGTEKTQEWVEKVFLAIQKGQEVFWTAERQFNRAEKLLLGKWVLVISDEPNPNPRFNRFCRSAIAKAKMPRPLSEKEDPIVVQFQENRGFQIFTNGSGYKFFDIAKALRAEILRVRRQRIPPDWQVLQSEGTLEGTEPLYYQQGNYEVIMWSSLTAPAVQPLDIPKEILRRAIIIATDQSYFTEECKRTEECLGMNCPIFPWKLLRCAKKRRNNRKNSLA